jgi:uncharacterized membrane protein (DUF2068 family)
MERPPGTDPNRSRRKIDWELVACGFRGHELVGIDAADLRPQDRLIARDEGPTRWHRCLRCDSWVALSAPEAPTRRHPPDQAEIEVPLRGKALRDKVVLRLIAVDRIFHFVILVALGIAVIAIAGNEAAVRSRFYRVLTDLQGGVAGGPVQTGRTGILRQFDKLFSLQAGTLRELGIALLAYGILEGVEAVGLWFAKRWAEYLTFIATTILLVPEVYELTNRATVLKVVGFIINLAVVIYLLFAKRLFGLRGGGAEDERLRAADMGWDALERATPPAALAGAGAAGAASIPSRVQ